MHILHLCAHAHCTQFTPLCTLRAFCAHLVHTVHIWCTVCTLSTLCTLCTLCTPCTLGAHLVHTVHSRCSVLHLKNQAESHRFLYILAMHAACSKWSGRETLTTCLKRPLEALRQCAQCAQCAHGVHSVHMVCTDLFADAAITVSVGLLRQHSAAPLGTCVIPHKKKAYTS